MTAVSIIMSAYNAADYLPTAVESVLGSGFTNWELLVADDGSSDNTRYIIDVYAQKDSRIKPHHNTENSGIVRTRNKLLTLASGKYITFLDADDWMAPDKLEKQLAVLANSNANAVGVNYMRVDLNGKTDINEDGRFKDRFTKEDIHQLPFWPPSIMINRTLYERVGGFSSFFNDMACYEDKYWLYNILEATDIVFVNEPLYFYRHNPSSVTRTLHFDRLAGQQLVAELIRQRLASGTDWLTSGRPELAENYMATLLGNQRWKGECCRRYAAIKTDERFFYQAARLLVRAWRQHPANKAFYHTALYWLRSAANPFNYFRLSSSRS